jgi:hypothetical protein
VLVLCVLVPCVLVLCVDTAESSFPGRWPAASGVPGARRLRPQDSLVNELILTRRVWFCQ